MHIDINFFLAGEKRPVNKFIMNYPKSCCATLFAKENNIPQVHIIDCMLDYLRETNAEEITHWLDTKELLVAGTSDAELRQWLKEPKRYDRIEIHVFNTD